MGKPIEIKARGDKTAEVLIYDVIGEDWWTGEGVTAKQFAKDLKALGAVDTLNVRINSPGGNVFDGIAIHNALTRSGARVEVDVDGMALSAASVIAMAGDVIRVAENAMVMIHNPYMGAMGDAHEMRKAAEILDGIKSALVLTYAKRTGRTDDEIVAWMDAETWWTGAQAVDVGFADATTAATRIANAFDGTLCRYKHGRAVSAALSSLKDRGARERVAKQKTRLAALSA